MMATANFMMLRSKVILLFAGNCEQKVDLDSSVLSKIMARFDKGHQSCVMRSLPVLTKNCMNYLRHTST